MYISGKMSFWFGMVLTASVSAALIQDGCQEPGFSSKPGSLWEMVDGQRDHIGWPRHLFIYPFRRCPAMFLDDQSSCILDDCSKFWWHSKPHLY